MYGDVLFDKIQKIKASEAFRERVLAEADKNHNRTFEDIKKLIKESAKSRNEPISHILIETMSSIIAARIIDEIIKEETT